MFLARLFGNKSDQGTVTDDRIAAALRGCAPTPGAVAATLTDPAPALPTSVPTPPSAAAMQRRPIPDAERPSQERLAVSLTSSDQSSDDDALMVLEAASELGDDAAVDACRRVIEAGEKGLEPQSSDLRLVQNYFR
jgi:hypothetical protein